MSGDVLLGCQGLSCALTSVIRQLTETDSDSKPFLSKALFNGQGMGPRPSRVNMTAGLKHATKSFLKLS